MAKASGLGRAIQHLRGRGPQPGLYSTADELIRQAPEPEMRPQQWAEWLKPGRVHEPAPGVQTALRKPELEETGLANILETLQRKAPEERVSQERLSEMLYEARPEMRRTLGVGTMHPRRPRKAESGAMEALNDELNVTQDIPLSGSLPPRTEQVAPRYTERSLYHQSPGARLEESITRVGDLDYRSHFGNDVVSWSRATVHDKQPSRYGTQIADPPKVRLVEEIQSDLHSNAAKRGLRDPLTGLFYPTEREARGALDEEGMARLKPDRRGYLTEKLIEEDLPDLEMHLEYLREEKGDLESALEKARTDEPHLAPQLQQELMSLRDEMLLAEKQMKEMEGRPPEAPFSDPREYARLELSKQLLSAADNGEEYLALTRGQDQINRYGGEGADEKRERGMRYMYDELYPSVMRKLAGRFGAEVVDVELPVGTQADLRLSSLAEMGAEDLEDAMDMMGDMTSDIDDLDVSLGTIDEIVSEMTERLDQLGDVSISSLDQARDWMNRAKKIKSDYLEAIEEMERVASDDREVTPEEWEKLTEEYVGYDSPFHNTWENLWSNLNDTWEWITQHESVNKSEKTFPAIHITPEVRERIRQAGAPLYSAAPAMMMEDEEKSEGFAEGGKATLPKREEETDGLRRLREIVETPFDYIPKLAYRAVGPEETVEERRALDKDLTSRMAQGLASQVMTLNRDTGEAEFRLPPIPIPFEMVEQGGMDYENWVEANREIMAQNFRPGLVDETLALPAMFGGGPKISQEAMDRTMQMRENLMGRMELDEPHGFLQHGAESLGMMAGQMPVPGSIFKKGAQFLKAIPGALGTAARWGTAPFRAGIEYLSPIVEPKASSYLTGAGFGATLGTVLDQFTEEDPEGATSLEDLIQAAQEDPEIAAALQRMIEEMDKEEEPGMAKGGKVKSGLMALREQIAQSLKDPGVEGTGREVAPIDPQAGTQSALTRLEELMQNYEGDPAALEEALGRVGEIPISRREFLQTAASTVLPTPEIRLGELMESAPTAARSLGGFRTAAPRVRDIAMSMKKSDLSPMELERLMDLVSRRWEAHEDVGVGELNDQGLMDSAVEQKILEDIAELADDTEFSEQERNQVHNLLEEALDVFEDTDFETQGHADEYRQFIEDLGDEMQTPRAFTEGVTEAALETVPDPSPRVRATFDEWAKRAPIFEDRMEYAIEDLLQSRLQGPAPLHEQQAISSGESLTRAEAEQLQQMLHAGNPNYEPF